MTSCCSRRVPDEENEADGIVWVYFSPFCCLKFIHAWVCRPRSALHEPTLHFINLVAHLEWTSQERHHSAGPAREGSGILLHSFHKAHSPSNHGPPCPCSKPLVHLAPSPCHRGIVQDYRSAPPFGERICTIPTSVISSIKISQGAFHQCVQCKVQVGTSE